MSYLEFLSLTENSDLRYEYIDGEVYCLASPNYKHQIAADEIYATFHNWFKGKKCKPLTSPFDVTLIKGRDNINVVQPDVIVICDTGKMDEKGRYQGVPTLVVGVLSASTRKKDLIKKLDLYTQTGIRECWMVDPDKQEISQYCFEKQNITDQKLYSGETTVRSACFKGLGFKLPWD